jgi:predicted TPR repeat methyltransferase
MAFSSSEGKEFFRDWMIHVARPLGFTRFLDVGCGSGLYGKIIREVMGNEVKIAGIEIFPDYVKQFNLKDIYNEVAIADILYISREHVRMPQFSLIIAGDVLEHLSKADAVEVVSNLKKKCKFLWAALPVKIGRPWSVGYQQPEHEYAVNPAERHLYDWSGEEIKECFKPLFLVPYLLTGTFLVEGEIP